jgi:CRISPR-associated protein Cas2
LFVILVYDIAEKRVAKVLKKCREYLYWVQNSVFEGEITEAKFKKLKEELKRIIDKEEDSVVIYNLRTTKYSSREVIGQQKGGQDLIL